MVTSNGVRDLRADGHSSVHVGNNTIVVQAPDRPETPPKPSSFIPFCQDRNFVERKDILDLMEQACSTTPSRVALMGLGGVGKSQLGIEYAYRVEKSFKQKGKELWVFWVHAGTRARFEQGFKEIADAVKIRGRDQPNADILQRVYQWLRNEHNGRWLMVLDSADDINVFYKGDKQSTTAGEETKALATYLPQSSNGSIIITTRSRDLAFRLTGHNSCVIDVGPMNRAEALALLKTKSESHFDEASGIELVEALGHMPLAIGQAAAYIQQRARHFSVKKYLEEFRQNEEKQFNLLNYDGGDLRREPDTPNSVITTLQITFEHIRSQRPTATELLSLMSFFDCQGIQDYLVQPIAWNETRKYDAHSENENVSTSKSLNDAYKEIFAKDIATLLNYSLISANETVDTFEMHRLVQFSIRKWLDMHKETGMFKMPCISRLARAFPPPHFSNWPACRKLFPHVEQTALYYPEDKELEQRTDFYQILYRGGWYSDGQGRYATAECMQEKALAVAKKLYGTEHKETANVMTSLALTYTKQRRWKDAEEMFKETIKIREADLNPDDPVTLESMSHLAWVHMKQGQLDVAELEFTQIIEKKKRVLGLDRLDTLTSMHNLASLYCEQKRWQEAELLLEEVVRKRKKVLGLENPSTLTSMHSLASAYIKQGRWQGGELLTKGVVEISKRVLGLEHPETLNSMHDLAFVYNRQEQWQEAELLLVQVVERNKRVLGPEHPDTLKSMGTLAHARKGLGHADVAMELMEQCAQAQIRVLGREHPQTQSSLSFLQHWRSGGSQVGERIRSPQLEAEWPQ
ncbi:P-loop containing nucleoside triphosphate hydrolase protein [Xylaria scruposa]|nr:P-loop containing nucleoside triphosphate hydrolase protein [Xylaria scruposa]